MSTSEYPYTIEGRPDFTFVTVTIPGGETLKVEASAMATMDTNIRMTTKMRGGLSRMLTGESLFINEFTAQGSDGTIGLAPGSPGDLEHYYLDGSHALFLQNSSFLACAPGVETQTKWQGFTKGFFSGENLFLIRCSGKGDLWFNSYGSLIEIDDFSSGFTVDTGHIVAFTESLSYRVKSVGGYKSLFFSGEGLVCEFSGSGRLWIQSHNVGAFANWVHPYRPKSSN